MFWDHGLNISKINWVTIKHVQHSNVRTRTVDNILKSFNLRVSLQVLRSSQKNKYHRYDLFLNNKTKTNPTGHFLVMHSIRNILLLNVLDQLRKSQTDKVSFI